MDYCLRNYRVYVISFLLLIIPLNTLNSEEPFCENESQVDYRDCSDFYNSEYQATIGVWVHIIDNDAGNGSQAVTEEEALLALNVLASDYDSHDIYFIIKGISYINDDYYYDIGYPDDPKDVFLENPHSDAIDIYLYPYHVVDGGASGEIPSTHLFIGGESQSGDIVGSSVLSHEMGHSLGLLHTFEHHTCMEFVNGDEENREGCGDLISDTAAEPVGGVGNQVNSSCQYTGSQVDPNNDQYDPDTDNIMAYTPLFCMWKLTTVQIERIFCHLFYESILTPVKILMWDEWDTPNAPTNLSWSNSGGHPKLTWTASTSSDVAGYNIYRNLGGSYRYIGYTPGPDATVYIDYSIEYVRRFAMNNAYYYVKAVMPWRSTISQPSNIVTVPTNSAEKQLVENFIVSEFALHNNRPNPFNPVTLLQVDLPEESFVELTVYDFLGRKINTLLNGSEPAGARQVLWDGTNQLGQQVASGVYIYTLSAVSYESEKRFTESKKMILLK